MEEKQNTDNIGHYERVRLIGSTLTITVLQSQTSRASDIIYN